MNKFLALSLVLVTAGSLTACNRAQDNQLGAGTTQQQREVAAGQSEVRGQEGNLENLKKDQPIDYYLSEFQNRGFDVADVQRRDNDWFYDLRRPESNQRYLVTLEQSPNTNRIENVDVKERKHIDVSANPEAQQLVQRLNQMKAGKQPSEYFMELNKVGTVTNYKLNDDTADITVLSAATPAAQQGAANQAQVREQARDKDLEFHVNMDVNPNTNKVTTIKVEQDVWGWGS